MGGQSLHWGGGWRSEGARASRYSLRASACRPVALVGCSNQCCIQVGYADGGSLLIIVRGGQSVRGKSFHNADHLGVRGGKWPSPLSAGSGCQWVVVYCSVHRGPHALYVSLSLVGAGRPR